MLKMILKMNFNFNLLRIAFVTSPRQRGKSPLGVIAITKDFRFGRAAVRRYLVWFFGGKFRPIGSVVLTNFG